MSIVKTLQTFIETYDGIEEIKNIPKVNTDKTDKEASSYALAPTGNSVTTRDVLGVVRYEHDYVFYAKEATENEINRQENYDFLEDFSAWIEEQNENDNLPVLSGKYKAESLSVSNIILFDVYDDGTGLYQVQIKLKIIKTV